MRIGASIFLIAVGAILKFALETSVDGINLATTGVILMIVGVIGLVISIAFWSSLTSSSRRAQATGSSVVTETETISNNPPDVV